jgi:hypothetical protein
MPPIHAIPGRCSKPRTLDEAHQVLAQWLSPAVLEELKTGTEQGAIAANRTIGRELRNAWGLWNGSHFRDQLVTLGLRHADEMSQLILVTFVRYLNGSPMRLPEEIERLRSQSLAELPRCPPCIQCGACTTARILDERFGRDRGFLIKDCCCGFRPQVIEGVLHTVRSTGEIYVFASPVAFGRDASCKNEFAPGS